MSPDLASVKEREWENVKEHSLSLFSPSPLLYCWIRPL